jgi:uncharacterized protein (DUF2141 family)
MLNRLMIALLLTGATQAAELTVTVLGVQHAEGKVMVAAYKAPERFLKQPSAVAWTDAQPGSVQATLHDLAPGEYAVSLYQDRNRNLQLDSNLLGIPTEPYGFSNDAVGKFGPPSFEQARILVPQEGGQITITLR